MEVNQTITEVRLALENPWCSYEERQAQWPWGKFFQSGSVKGTFVCVRETAQSDNMCRGFSVVLVSSHPETHVLYPVFWEAMKDINRFCSRNKAVKLSSEGSTCNFWRHLVVQRWRPVLGLKLHRIVRRPEWIMKVPRHLNGHMTGKKTWKKPGCSHNSFQPSFRGWLKILGRKKRNLKCYSNHSWTQTQLKSRPFARFTRSMGA